MEAAMQETDQQGLIEAYLEAFKERDLARCLEFFHDDGLLIFGPRAFGLGRFRGREALEQWHKERFEKGMKIDKIEGIHVDGDKVVVKAVVSSPVLKAIHLDDFRGQATFIVDAGKIKEANLGLRAGYRFHI
jgi:ketosteroid isomerase-like protein